jgi:hypothetical protein
MGTRKGGVKLDNGVLDGGHTRFVSSQQRPIPKLSRSLGKATRRGCVEIPSTRSPPRPFRSFLRLSKFWKNVTSTRCVQLAAFIKLRIRHVYRRQRSPPLRSRTAKSRHQSQLGLDGLDVAHARNLWPYVAGGTSARAQTNCRFTGCGVGKSEG